MNRAQFLVLGLFVVVLPTAYCQVVTLTCKSELTAAYIESQLKHPTGYCGTFPERCKSVVEEMETCKASKLDYSHKRVYTFEKSALNSLSPSRAEFSNHICWSTEVATKIADLEATPSIVSFTEKGSEQYRFNVDRESLAAGIGIDRKWKCEIAEKKIKNKI